MPETVPQSRVDYIQSLGVEVEKFPGDKLLKAVDSHVKDGYHLVHPLDDIHLIAGYSPIAKEILQQVEGPDIVLVGCGGGSLLAGLSTGFALSGSNAVIYGVEPETASTMKQSFEKGHPVVLNSAKSVASGLAPPMAGSLAYEHCKKYVKDILLVSNEEIVETCKMLFERSLKVEPSGCAALAALIFNKIPNLEELSRNKGRKLNIVVIISGGNISTEELAKLFQDPIYKSKAQN